MTLRKLRMPLLRLSFIPMVLVAIFVRPRWEMDSVMSFSIEFLGYLFLLAGLLIRIWCTLYIGSRKSKKLIMEGPYSICRNPLYIGSFFLAVGIGLCFENLILLMLIPLIIIPVHIIIAKLEEANLKQNFGQDYVDYQKLVPRFGLKISNYNSPETINISIHSIRRIAIDTFGVLMLPMLEDLLELLHDGDIIPVLWYFPK